MSRRSCVPSRRIALIVQFSSPPPVEYAISPLRPANVAEEAGA
jgi:hypothetical protein